MTIDEYKTLYPQDEVFIQVDDTERTMTDEEYEAWVFKSVQRINDRPVQPTKPWQPDARAPSTE